MGYVSLHVFVSPLGFMIFQRLQLRAVEAPTEHERDNNQLEPVAAEDAMRRQSWVWAVASGKDRAVITTCVCPGISVLDAAPKIV